MSVVVTEVEAMSAFMIPMFMYVRSAVLLPSNSAAAIAFPEVNSGVGATYDISFSHKLL